MEKRALGMAFLLTLSGLLGIQSGALAAQENASEYATAVKLSPGALTVTPVGPTHTQTITVSRTASRQAVYLPIPRYLVRDSRGTGEGWSLALQLSPLMSPEGAIPTGVSVRLAPPTVICEEGTACSGRAVPPRVGFTAPTSLNSDEEVLIASAQANQGMGTYQIVPASFDGDPTHNLEITLPESVEGGTYQSSLTVSITSGP